MKRKISFRRIDQNTNLLRYFSFTGPPISLFSFFDCIFGNLIAVMIIFYTFVKIFSQMIIINRQVLLDFTRKHTDAIRPVTKWISDVEKAQWTSFADVKNTYRTADYVGNDHIVFDIKGNTYRLVTIVIFEDGVVNIRWAGTHAEYDKITDCSIL